MYEHIRQYSANLSKALGLDAMNQIPALGKALLEAWRENRNIYLCGNGGSAGNAIHIANDFLYGAGINNSGGLRVEALSANPAVLTCLGNDLGYDEIYAERPWGHYEGVDAGDRFQVKRLTVYPGASLSLQLHHHRAEHWVVVKGTAKVTRGDEVFTLTENQSTYIPVETKHRLENPEAIPLEVIEVQSGDYLGEDDIERFEDKYSRK